MKGFKYHSNNESETIFLPPVSPSVNISKVCILNICLVLGLCAQTRIFKSRYRWSVDAVPPPVLEDAHDRVKNTGGYHDGETAHHSADAQGIVWTLTLEEELGTDDVAEG